MSDESFRAELRTWLAAHITDEFRERRTMTFQEQVAVRRAWQKKLFEAGWIGIGWPQEYGGRGTSLMQEAIYNEEMARAQAPATANGKPVLEDSQVRQRLARLYTDVKSRQLYGRVIGSFQGVAYPGPLT